jgi:hypothetical protein
MPPVNPQGSRSGLITAVVIFSIGFVASTVFAIYFGVALNKADDEITSIKQQTKGIYVSTSAAVINPDTMTYFRQKANTDPNVYEKSILAAVLRENIENEKTIAGETVSTTQPSQARAEAQATLADVSSKIQGVDTSSLVDAVKSLADKVVALQAQSTGLRGDQTTAAGDAAKQIADMQTKMAAMQTAMDELTKEKQQALDAAQAADDTYTKKFSDEALAMDTERQSWAAQLRKLEIAAQDLNKRIAQLVKQNTALADRVAGHRQDVVEPIVRQADGIVLSVASDDIVYINLGAQDHIVPGMTFEVYSQRDGVPKLGDGMSEDNLPIGEGSIEIQKIGQESSECKVTHLETGQHITPNDVIANLVYDRNIKYNFFVYGKFDLSLTNHPNDKDILGIKQQIVLWGGQIQNVVNVDTDFVVMGAEPVVENFTPADLQDPFKVKLQADEQDALKKYEDVLDQAKQLHIPIMNQNRFLYFTGYRALANR